MTASILIEELARARAAASLLPHWDSLSETVQREQRDHALRELKVLTRVFTDAGWRIVAPTLPGDVAEKVSQAVTVGIDGNNYRLAAGVISSIYETAVTTLHQEITPHEPAQQPPHRPSVDD